MARPADLTDQVHFKIEYRDSEGHMVLIDRQDALEIAFADHINSASSYLQPSTSGGHESKGSTQDSGSASRKGLKHVPNTRPHLPLHTNQRLKKSHGNKGLTVNMLQLLMPLKLYISLTIPYPSRICNQVRGALSNPLRYQSVLISYLFTSALK